MALSEQEQRALREIERSLMNDDPKFGAAVSGDGFGGGGALTLRGIAVIVIGLVMLVSGVALSQVSLWFVVLSIAGFLVMLAGAIWMLRSMPSDGVRRESASLGSGKAKAKNGNGIANRMEDNFRKRFEQ
ncbi:DUF3040 domain-containing protein [Corynebacterium sp. ZY180755]